MARAIVTKPRVLLLDEPLSALDKALRSEMQIELKRIQREVGITTIFVTHDQEEALSMADRIGILRDGRLIQEGAPEVVYNRPVTEFAATFLGDANILRGTVASGGLRLSDGTLIMTCDAPGADRTPAACAVGAGADRTPAGRVERRGVKGELPAWPDFEMHLAGSSSTYFVDCGAETLKVIVQNAPGLRLEEGSGVTLHWSPDSTIVVRT